MDEISQYSFMISELLIMVNNGNNLSTEQVEQLADDHKLFSYLKENFGFRNQYVIHEDMSQVQKFLDYDVIVTQRNAEERLLQDNGLLYLADRLTDKLTGIAFEYKWNYGDSLEKLEKLER